LAFTEFCKRSPPTRRVNRHRREKTLELRRAVGVKLQIRATREPRYLTKCERCLCFAAFMEHKGRLEKLKVAYIGDANNVARSLALGIASVGSSFVIASPLEYTLDPTTLGKAIRIASSNNCQISTFTDPIDAIAGADVVYTDVWTSMGQEKEQAQRLNTLSPYQLNEAVVAVAKPDAIVLHCLPAHRGEEITEAVIDGPQSAVLDQAENRLHVQKAILIEWLGRPCS